MVKVWLSYEEGYCWGSIGCYEYHFLILTSVSFLFYYMLICTSGKNANIKYGIIRKRDISITSSPNKKMAFFSGYK